MEAVSFTTLQFYQFRLTFQIVLTFYLIVMVRGTHARKSVIFSVFMTLSSPNVPLYPILCLDPQFCLERH